MLEKNKKYLQIALNRSLEEISSMIYSLPPSDRIIIEVGYPLIKTYGIEAIRKIKRWWKRKSSGSLSFIPYVVADLKCMDRAFTEVEAAASAGASAATCLGLAPLETIDAFIRRCEELGIDSILDMINVEFPFEILSKLKKQPRVVMLHRGVDEGEENKEKELPLHEIERIKSVYDEVLVAIAGGETIEEVISGVFNDADILVVWRPFNENPERILYIANEFLKEIK
jgi:3-hexulose-6-phosphate synthase